MLLVSNMRYQRFRICTTIQMPKFLLGRPKLYGTGLSSKSISWPVLLLSLLTVVTIPAHSQQEVEIAGNRFAVSHPPGYVLEAVNLKLNGPRMLYFHGDEILVGSRDDRIYRLFPPYDQVQTLAHLPLYPHSMLIRDDEIIIADPRCFSSQVLQCPKLATART